MSRASGAKSQAGGCLRPKSAMLVAKACAQLRNANAARCCKIRSAATVLKTHHDLGLLCS